MNTIRKKSLLCIIVLIILAILIGMFYIKKFITLTPDIINSQTLPKINFKLGENFQSLQMGSAYPIKLIKFSSTITASGIGGEPVILENIDPKHGFTLPPSNFIIITFNKNKLVNIDVSPQVGMLNLKDSITMIYHLMTILKQADWCEAKSLYVNNKKPEELADFFRDHNAYRTYIMSWRNDTQIIDLSIQRALKAQGMQFYNALNEKKIEDQFLLQLSISDYQDLSGYPQLADYKNSADYLKMQPCIN